LSLTAEKIARAETCAPELFHRMRRFLERYDFLLCPVSQLLAYPSRWNGRAKLRASRWTIISTG
jgi:hypothetical protein